MSRWSGHVCNWERSLGIESHKWMTTGSGMSERQFFDKWATELRKAMSCRKYQRRLEYLNPEIRTARQVSQRKYDRGESAIKNRAKRYATDLNYLIKRRLRGRMSVALRTQKKAGKTEELLGCSFEFFRKHIESQWKYGMCWKNYGIHGWHVDHIVPCYKFDLSTREEQKRCFHYTNLQPLWAHENLRKDAMESSALRGKR